MSSIAEIAAALEKNALEGYRIVLRERIRAIPAEGWGEVRFRSRVLALLDATDISAGAQQQRESDLGAGRRRAWRRPALGL